MDKRPDDQPVPQQVFDFDGSTYDPEHDQARLSSQFLRVRQVMLDGQPHTLEELSILAEAPQASVSARLRDMRKPRFGGHVIERQYVQDGLFSYRLIRPLT